MFKNDVLETFNKIFILSMPAANTGGNTFQLKTKIIQNKNKVNIETEIHQTAAGNNPAEQTIIQKTKNIKIYPYLCFDKARNLLVPQIAISFHPFLEIAHIDPPIPISSYKTLDELKQANPDWSNKIIGSANAKLILGLNPPVFIKSFYVIHQSYIVENKIFEIDSSQPIHPGSNLNKIFGRNGLSILINVDGPFEFNANKITDLQQHLQK